MRARSDPPRVRRIAGAVGVLGTAVTVGVVWLLAEAALLATTDPIVDRGELLRRGVELLVWQVVLFALLGLVLAAPARLFSWGREDRVWWTLAAASYVFLSARVAEGLLRQNSPRLAVVTAVGLGLALTLLFVALRSVGRALPPALRAGWTWGTWSAWTLLFIPFLRRAGPSLGNGKIGLTEGLGFFEARDFVLAAACGTLVLLVASGLRRARAPAVG